MASVMFVVKLLLSVAFMVLCNSKQCTNCCHERETVEGIANLNKTESCTSIKEATLCADKFGRYCLWSCNKDILHYDNQNNIIEYIKTINITPNVTQKYESISYGTNMIYTVDDCAGIVYRVSPSPTSRIKTGRQLLMYENCVKWGKKTIKPPPKKTRNANRNGYTKYGFKFCNGGWMGNGRLLYGVHIKTPLFHGTSKFGAEGIAAECNKLKDEGKPCQSVMWLGKSGWYGPGIYLAETPEASQAKAQHGAGYVVMVTIASGNAWDVIEAGMSWSDPTHIQDNDCWKKRLEIEGKDSVYVSTMVNNYKTTIRRKYIPADGKKEYEKYKHSQKLKEIRDVEVHGVIEDPEWIVYYQDQVLVERIYEFAHYDKPLFVHERDNTEEIAKEIQYWEKRAREKHREQLQQENIELQREIKLMKTNIDLTKEHALMQKDLEAMQKQLAADTCPDAKDDGKTQQKTQARIDYANRLIEENGDRIKQQNIYVIHDYVADQFKLIILSITIVLFACLVGIIWGFCGAFGAMTACTVNSNKITLTHE